MIIDFINRMTELYFDGYSEYELEALKIPSDARGKCLKKLVDYTLCHQKAGATRMLFTRACEDEKARFDRCHQKSVNYYTGATVGNMLYNNPGLFHELAVSPTYEEAFTSPTPLRYHR